MSFLRDLMAGGRRSCVQADYCSSDCTILFAATQSACKWQKRAAVGITVGSDTCAMLFGAVLSSCCMQHRLYAALDPRPLCYGAVLSPVACPD